jgi:hypothetical protein
MFINKDIYSVICSYLTVRDISALLRVNTQSQTLGHIEKILRIHQSAEMTIKTRRVNNIEEHHIIMSKSLFDPVIGREFTYTCNKINNSRVSVLTPIIIENSGEGNVCVIYMDKCCQARVLVYPRRWSSRHYPFDYKLFAYVSTARIDIFDLINISMSSTMNVYTAPLDTTYDVKASARVEKFIAKRHERNWIKTCTRADVIEFIHVI